MKLNFLILIYQLMHTVKIIYIKFYSEHEIVLKEFNLYKRDLQNSSETVVRTYCNCIINSIEVANTNE